MSSCDDCCTESSVESYDVPDLQAAPPSGYPVKKSLAALPPLIQTEFNRFVKREITWKKARRAIICLLEPFDQYEVKGEPDVLKLIIPEERRPYVLYRNKFYGYEDNEYKVFYVAFGLIANEQSTGSYLLAGPLRNIAANNLNGKMSTQLSYLVRKSTDEGFESPITQYPRLISWNGRHSLWKSGAIVTVGRFTMIGFVRTSSGSSTAQSTGNLDGDHKHGLDRPGAFLLEFSGDASLDRPELRFHSFDQHGTFLVTDAFDPQKYLYIRVTDEICVSSEGNPVSMQNLVSGYGCCY